MVDITHPAGRWTGTRRIGVFSAILALSVSCRLTNTSCSTADATCNPLLLWPRPLRPVALVPTRVYGQYGSFTTNTSNTPSRSADTLFDPFKVSIDPGGIYVADQQNARLLFYPGTSTTATRVYGTAGDFTVSGDTGITDHSFFTGGINMPEVFSDATGVYLSDIWASRVLFFSGTSTAAATRVYGQFGVFTWGASNNNGANGVGTPSTATLSNPQGIAADSTGVYIVDVGNNRMLYYPGTSTTATRVYGQGGSFTSNGSNKGGISADSLNAPRGVWVDNDGVYIADVVNNRILFYPGTSTSAARVYGQSGDFSTNVSGASSTLLNGPWFVCTFAGSVYVADTANHRILEFVGTSTTATRVWGQNGDFTTASAGVSATSLNQPMGIQVDVTGMYVADYLNNRVLFFPREVD